ncbi:MAG TPA: sulfite oxidase [Devosiaceae bacterium]|jgi:DMSO/TMAO reductase YedYZ molybdopterin-dependent catalytic subunit|nr:sulfite oxidase [Devosiaceae bacterium]
MTEFEMRRRSFLVGSVGTLVGVGVAGSAAVARGQEAGPLPEYADWKNPEALIVHSQNTMETRRGFIGTSGITASEELYVRNNLPPPEEAIAAGDDWEVTFEGVGEPRTLTVGEIKELGIATVATVLQCSGNGRGFFEHETSGSQWLTGAAGNVLWSGVPVRTVIEALGGAADGMNYMTSTGGENLPEGVEPKSVVVERSVPLEAAMENAILAWEMNGQPIPLAHGGPLRVIVPGYYGINNIKYVKRVALTEDETDAKIQASGYRVRPVGVDGAPDQPTMWEMKVKSWVTHPLADTETGKVQIHGVAFGGINAVESVEVSIDGGETWQPAEFVGPDFGRYAWRPFVLSTELEPGTYTITSRATDAAGRVQEEVTEPNHRGYDYSGWRKLAVDVTVV